MLVSWGCCTILPLTLTSYKPTGDDKGLHTELPSTYETATYSKIQEGVAVAEPWTIHVIEEGQRGHAGRRPTRPHGKEPYHNGGCVFDLHEIGNYQHLGFRLEPLQVFRHVDGAWFGLDS
ncbi:hypothetical protein GOP47_0007357 [Adiantum capillus-veneris]|uniref:Uncharacterized protein n=1 Tax=Adiantum capillus-veneris TaxID=13818 RepID=A0A9D4V0Q9_ADICA|nr:hypothetical protein GOP47_0007357 [Adiantum capillus-veneris]